MPKVERITDLERSAIEAYGDFTVVNESYGFSVRPGPMRRRRAILVEWCAQYLGFLSIFATFGLVAGSTGLSGSQLDLFEAGIFMTGAVLATVFFWIGTRGTAVEMQVDTFRRQFRSVVRNYRDAERVLEVHDYTSIESAFVSHRSQNSITATFSLRTHEDPNGVAMLAGNARAVTNMHVVLADILRPVVRQVAAKKPSCEKSATSVFGVKSAIFAD